MNNLGQRIKELRKKNDLTQERLADYLGVTYQSVSKWETGVTMPDLALILPMAKFLHVTTDELLGAKEEDKRLAELEELYQEALRGRGDETPLALSGKATDEYPGNMMWLNRYAWDVWCYAIDNIPDGEAFEVEREKAIKLFDRVIGNTDDIEQKASAITGIVGCYCGKGWVTEAKRYVDLYPDTEISLLQKRNLVANCLKDDEQKAYRQQSLEMALRELVDRLIWYDNFGNDDSNTAAYGVITAVISDGNYLEYHRDISRIHLKHAETAVQNGAYENAMALVKKALYHAKEFDKIEADHRGEYRYTAPTLDRYTIDTKNWFRASNGTLFEEHEAALCQRKVFAPLREREDFKALFR